MRLPRIRLPRRERRQTTPSDLAAVNPPPAPDGSIASVGHGGGDRPVDEGLAEASTGPGALQGTNGAASGRSGRIVVGRPTVTFEPVAPDSTRFRPPYRPDSVVDAWSVGPLAVRAASVRGDDHRFRGTPRQDDLIVLVHPKSGSVIAAVADGVSAATQSHLGATAACRYAADELARLLDAGADVDWEDLLKKAAWAVVEVAQRLEGTDQPNPSRAEELCGTTLSIALIRPSADGAAATVVSAGDSGATLLRAGQFLHATGGKEAIDGISSSAVTALPRISINAEPRHIALEVGDVLLLASDGILDPLGEGQGLVGQMLRAQLAAPPDLAQFLRVVDFSRETFDDDRTLVAVWYAPVFASGSVPVPAATAESPVDTAPGPAAPGEGP